MQEEGRWVTINGTHVFVKNGQSPIDALIRQKTLKENPEQDFKGHFEDEKEHYEFVNGEMKKVKSDAYYQLDNGEKIEFLDKKEYKKMIDDFYDSLNDDEKHALHIWIDDPAWMSGAGLYKYDKDYNKIMDDMFETKGIELPRDTLLFRRSSDDYLDLESGVNRVHAMSTSAYNTIPKTMPSGKPFGDKEIYILAPKGTKVLPIEKVAVNHPSNNDTDKRIYTKQHEMILPKGTSYEVVDDLSSYYYRPAKGNERYDVETTDQKYVVKLTNKKYNKQEYNKPEYYWQRNTNGYENYIYNHNGKQIHIEEKYMGDRDTKFKKKSRKEVVKYRVSDLMFKGQEEYYDSYDDAVKAIKKYL